MDRDFGLIHARVQTWFPLQLQVYVNGHEWLARKLVRHGVRYTKHDNAFLWLEEFARAQRWSDRFASLPWVALLDRYARRVNPLLRDVLTAMQYYWVTTQAEYATDLVFKSRAQLADLVPRLLDQSTLCFSARDVLSFLAQVARRIRGRGGHGAIRLCRTRPGAGAAGQAPHETELAEDVRESRLDSPGGDGDQRPGGVSGAAPGPAADRMGAAPEERGLPLPLSRRRTAEQRALSQRVGPGGRPHARAPGLDTITTRKQPVGGRTLKAFNPVARPEYQLFVALMSGEHAVHGFANRDLRAKLTGQLRPAPKRQSAQISRLLHRLHVFGLVAKIPRSRRWRVTGFGHRVMSASVRLRQLHFPAFYAEAA
jgi:hypothetical protein